MTAVEHRMEGNSNKKRRFDLPEGILNPADIDTGYQALLPILENEVLCAKIPTRGMAFDLLAKWFQIIAGDQEKLNLFRHWVMPSAEFDSKKASTSVSIKKDIDDPEELSTKATSINFINNETPITPRSTPQVLLLQQLLQQQQQQIVLLQKLQKSPTTPHIPLTTLTTITLTPTSGSAGIPLIVHMKGGQWHAHSSSCTCTCGFTATDGSVSTTRRVAGGGEGEMRFLVPLVPFPSNETARMSMVVHLTSCSAPHAPLVCADSFFYGRERHTVSVTSSDEDSEDTPESSVCDDDEGDVDSGDRGSPDAPSGHLSPKQLMTIRERMMEFIHSSTKGSARLVVTQQPPSRVVWKNRRLDTPFKVRVEGTTCDTPATKLTTLAIVVDHKGKLQIDAMENFEEDCTPQGIALFHNLRMTKGTWGKEWSITFVVVGKASMSTSNPVVVGVSQACPVVVKTRKNPQVRHVGGIARAESPPSPITFVERKPDNAMRLKRNRVEDILDHDSHPRSHPHSQSGLHSEDMTSLLYAAEIKQQEREFQVVRRPPPPPPQALSSSPSPPSSPPRAFTLPTVQNGFGGPESNFANLQGLLGYLEEIKLKHRPSVHIVEQPQLKRDSKVLVVKKGKPFRTPFRLQMRTMPSSAHGFNPQQYVCVAVVRNDKGEEVALKNGEVSFDMRGIATFSGLMVMKGTWGKTVQLSFEARWGGTRRIPGGNNNSWPPLRMLVVSETPALQLMCYTKDKKSTSSVS